MGDRDARWLLGGRSTARGDQAGTTAVEDPADGFASATKTFTLDGIEPNGAVVTQGNATGTADGYDGLFRGKPITLTGNVTLGGVGTPLADTVDVTRTDAQYPSGKFIGTATAGADGAFRFVDTPEVGGDVTYRLTPDVTGNNLTSSPLTLGITLTRAEPTVSLSLDKSSYSYDGTINLMNSAGMVI